jgi:hypothetical protein
MFERAFSLRHELYEKTTVNCYDQAAALTVFGRLIGIEARYTYSSSFGYINTTTLVGGISTNNPFFNTTSLSYFGNNYSNNHVVDITTLGSTVPYALYRRTYDYDNILRGDRSSFGNHAYVTLGNGDPATYKTYDACAGPITDTLLTTYFTNTIDFLANTQHNTREGVNRFLGTTEEFVSNITTASINYLE